MGLGQIYRQQWLTDIAKALARVGFVGNTFDFSKGSGVVPSTSMSYSSATPASVAATAVVGTATSGANHADHQHAMGIVTTKGDLLTYGTSPQRHAVGTNGYVLTADSTQTDGVKWAAPASNPMTTEGDIIYEHGSVAARLPVGGAGYFLVSDGTDPYWASILTDMDGNVLTDTDGNVLLGS